MNQVFIHQYFRKYMFDKHLLTHLDTTFSCDQCDYITKVESKLASHCKRVHSATVPRAARAQATAASPTIHKCSYCGYSSKRKHNVTTHEEKCCQAKRKAVGVNVQQYTCADAVEEYSQIAGRCSIRQVAFSGVLMTFS